MVKWVILQHFHFDLSSPSSLHEEIYGTLTVKAGQRTCGLNVFHLSRKPSSNHHLLEVEEAHIFVWRSRESLEHLSYLWTVITPSLRLGVSGRTSSVLIFSISSTVLAAAFTSRPRLTTSSRTPGKNRKTRARMISALVAQVGDSVACLRNLPLLCGNFPSRTCRCGRLRPLP